MNLIILVLIIVVLDIIMNKHVFKNVLEIYHFIRMNNVK